MRLSSGRKLLSAVNEMPARTSRSTHNPIRSQLAIPTRADHSRSDQPRLSPLPTRAVVLCSSVGRSARMNSS